MVGLPRNLNKASLRNASAIILNIMIIVRITTSLMAMASAARGEEQHWTLEDAVRSLPSLSLYTIVAAPLPEEVEMDASTLSFVYSTGGGFQYEVFISFRGTDTRKDFTYNLYQALRSKGIHTFFDDDELRKGEKITPKLVEAIEGSKIAVVVFSRSYAYSSFCLLELAKIMECIKGDGRWVFPVFYQVEPSDVRYQNGTYADALRKHEENPRVEKEKLLKWREALKQAAHLSGNHFKLDQGEYEHDFIEKIVKEISNRISRVPLHVAEHPVGLESRLLEVNKLLDGEFDSGARMVGIYGVGGIGKTTLAKALYNKLIADDQFEALCFLENVRECSSGKHDGLLAYLQLQEKLLCKILGDNFYIKLGSDSEGISLIKQRFQSMKILLVLDDVDKVKQLQKLAGSSNWFGFGSIIIITTRDEHLLKSQMVVRRYRVEEFDKKEALELLTWHAFKGEDVDPSYMEILHKMVRYASGIPLALEVIGSNLYGRSVEEWISALEEYKKIPNRDIQKILRVSFDALGEYHKKLFLDIVFLFKRYDTKYIKYIKDRLHALHDVDPMLGIRVMAERSLIKISDEDKNGTVTQHDLIQDMGREIVRQESPENPGERSRLWIAEDVMQVLEQNIGTNKIELIILDALMSKVIDWDGEAFRKMGNLKTLIIERGNFFNGPNHLPNSLRVLEWRRYPSHSLPPDFHPKKLSILKLPSNCLTQHQLVKLLKEFVDLTVLDLSGNDWITYIPDVSGAPNLKKLRFGSCQNLVKIDESVGLLSKLEQLDVSGCPKLKSLPSLMLSPSLLSLQITHCPSLESFPEISGKMENMTYLDLFKTSIRELPYSICNLTRLQYLRLESGESQTIILPRSIFMLQELRQLHIVRCKVQLSYEEEEDTEQGSSVSCAATTFLNLRSSNISDKFLEIILPHFPNLKELNLSESNLRILPACIESCQLLWFLRLNGCKNLEEIRGIPPNIFNLNAVGTPSLSSSSREVVFNKEVHEKIGKKRFIFPGTSIPSWFENQSSGQPISFWFRNQFPAISLCFLLKESDNNEYNIRKICPRMDLVRNGNHNGRHVFHDRSCMRAPGHIWVYDLEDNGGQQFQQNEWNQALVFLSEITWDGHEKGFREVRAEEWASIEIGVHIIKERSNMDDIKFTDPHLDKHDNKTLHITDSHNHLVQDQPDRELRLSLQNPEFRDDFDWDPRDNFLFKMEEGYRRPWISRFHDWKVAVKKATGESCNAPSSGKAIEEEETTDDDDDDDDEMDAFYDSVDVAGIPMLSISHEKLVTTTPSHEEIRQVLRDVQELFFSRDAASILLESELCSFLKANLDYLSKLCADHGSISTETSKLLILEASQLLTRWSREYPKAHTKIDYIMSQLQRAGELEMSLESNKKRFLEVVASRKRKRDIFEEGKTIKAELDELKKNVPQWEYEHTLAKKTQANIIAEWLRLRETFQNIEKDWNLQELD